MRTGGGGPGRLVGSRAASQREEPADTFTLFDNPMWLLNRNRIEPNGIQMLACTHSHSAQTHTLWWKGPEPQAAVTRGPGVTSQSLLNHLLLACFPFMALRQREEEEGKKVKSQQSYLALLLIRMEIPRAPVLVGCSLVYPWAQHTTWNILCVQLTTVDRIRGSLAMPSRRATRNIHDSQNFL